MILILMNVSDIMNEPLRLLTKYVGADSKAVFIEGVSDRLYSGMVVLNKRTNEVSVSYMIDNFLVGSLGVDSKMGPRVSKVVADLEDIIVDYLLQGGSELFLSLAAEVMKS